MSQTVADISQFLWFSRWGCRHLEFSKIRNFNGLYAVGGQNASSCQISSKSVKRFSKWRPSAILDLWNSNFLIVAAVKGHILHQHNKFYRDRSNRYGDIAFFVIFQDDGRCHLEFSKIQNFYGHSAVRGQHPSLYQILSKSVKRLQRYSDFMVFSKRRHLGFVGRRLGPPTMTSWWSLSMCKIWLKSMQ